MLAITLANANPISKTRMRCNNNIDPNNVTNYLSIEGINRLEAEFRNYTISTKSIGKELSLIQFHLWTPLVINNNAGQQKPWIFNATVSPKELINHGFLTNRETKFIAHGWNSDADFGDRFRIGKSYKHIR